MKWRIVKHTDGNDKTYYTVQYKRRYWFWCDIYIHAMNSFWGIRQLNEIFLKNMKNYLFL